MGKSNMHYDCLGQLISVGAKVLWSAHNSHAGFDQGVMDVVSMSPKRVRVEHGDTGRKSTVDPRSLGVVDLILAQHKAQKKPA